MTTYWEVPHSRLLITARAVFVPGGWEGAAEASTCREGVVGAERCDHSEPGDDRCQGRGNLRVARICPVLFFANEGAVHLGMEGRRNLRSGTREFNRQPVLCHVVYRKTMTAQPASDRSQVSLGNAVPRAKLFRS